jgi:hypothetical protein
MARVSCNPLDPISVGRAADTQPEVAATADLRHFFCQLSIAKADRRYFSLLVHGEVYEHSSYGVQLGRLGCTRGGYMDRCDSRRGCRLAMCRRRELREFSPPPHWLVYEGESLVGIGDSQVRQLPRPGAVS